MPGKPGKPLVPLVPLLLPPLLLLEAPAPASAAPDEPDEEDDDEDDEDDGDPPPELEVVLGSGVPVPAAAGAVSLLGSSDEPSSAHAVSSANQAKQATDASVRMRMASAIAPGVPCGTRGKTGEERAACVRRDAVGGGGRRARGDAGTARVGRCSFSVATATARLQSVKGPNVRTTDARVNLF